MGDQADRTFPFGIPVSRRLFDLSFRTHVGTSAAAFHDEADNVVRLFRNRDQSNIETVDGPDIQVIEFHRNNPRFPVDIGAESHIKISGIIAEHHVLPFL